MNNFTEAAWPVVKIGLVTALVPVLVFIVTEPLPALLMPPAGAWAK